MLRLVEDAGCPVKVFSIRRWNNHTQLNEVFGSGSNHNMLTAPYSRQLNWLEIQRLGEEIRNDRLDILFSWYLWGVPVASLAAVASVDPHYDLQRLLGYMFPDGSTSPSSHPLPPPALPPNTPPVVLRVGSSHQLPRNLPGVRAVEVPNLWLKNQESSACDVSPEIDSSPNPYGSQAKGKLAACRTYPTRVSGAGLDLSQFHHTPRSIDWFRSPGKVPHKIPRRTHTTLNARIGCDRPTLSTHRGEGSILTSGRCPDAARQTQPTAGDAHCVNRHGHPDVPQ